MFRSTGRLVFVWFCTGVMLPLTLLGAAWLSNLVPLLAVESTFRLLAVGSCPFWLFLWWPAMTHPKNDVLFLSVALAVVLANGCLYMPLANVQSRTRSWTASTRVGALLIAYILLIAMGYGFSTGVEYLFG